jgi:hypothetical protein
MNEKITRKKIVGCKKIKELKDLCEFLYNVKCKWPILVAAHLLGRFESHRGHRCLSFVSVICCLVQVSVMGWSPLQSSTECGVSEGDLETSTMRKPGSYRSVEPWNGMKVGKWSDNICAKLKVKVKVNNPTRGLDRPWGFQEAEAPRFQDNREIKVVTLSALHTGRLYHQEIFLVLISVRLSQPQGHSAATRIMSIKNFNDTIKNQSRYLLVCSAVPQPTVPPGAPLYVQRLDEIWEKILYLILDIQSVPGGKDLTSGECSLGQTIPI